MLFFSFIYFFFILFISYEITVGTQTNEPTGPINLYLRWRKDWYFSTDYLSELRFPSCLQGDLVSQLQFQSKFLFLSVCLSVSFYLSLSLALSLAPSLSLSLSLCFFLCFSLCLSVSLVVFLSLPFSLCYSFSASLSLSPCISVSLALSLLCFFLCKSLGNFWKSLLNRKYSTGRATYRVFPWVLYHKGSLNIRGCYIS